MEEQQRTQQLFSNNSNGKYPQPLIPTYTAPLQENSKTDEWDLRQFLAVVRRRAVVIGTVGIGLSAAIWFSTLSREAQYQGGFRLLVEPVTGEVNVAEELTPTPGQRANQQLLDYDTQLQVLQSPALLAPIIKQLSTRYPDINYGSLINQLTISRFIETKILEIGYTDGDPQKVQFVLEHLAKGYLKYSLEERQTNLRQGIQFVDRQMPQLQKRVNNLQKQLQQFRQQYDFVDPEAKAEQLSDLASSVKLERQNIQNQLAQRQAFYATLKGKSGEQLAQATTLNKILQYQPNGTEAATQKPNGKEALVEKEAPIYEGLVSQVRTVESQIATELTRFQEDSPTINNPREKRQNLLPVLRQEGQRVLGNKLVEVANQISLLELQAADIAKSESSLDQQVKQLPVLTRHHTDLQRELKIATDSLNRFMEKRQSLQIESAQKDVPWQMISAPQLPQVPVSGDVRRNLILGAITGLLAGLGAALLAERLDKVFHSPEDFKEATKLPLLGVIPFHKHLKHLKQQASVARASVERQADGYKVVARNISSTEGYSYFPFLEAFRSLYTNIGFLGSDTPIHSVVVSSAVHADGKSTVSLNLAQAAAAMGKRVLLVDADLRRPQVHTLLGLPNEQGLSNAISSNLPVLELIQKSPLSDNLFLLTSGQIPPDPTKLLSSKKMQNIMEQLRQHFDFVIYDTPPLMGLADSSLLAAYTAGIVLVARMAKTDRSVLKQAIDGLKLSRANILGTVCNDVKNYNNNNTAYGYYYYRPRAQSSKVN